MNLWLVLDTLNPANLTDFKYPLWTYKYNLSSCLGCLRGGKVEFTWGLLGPLGGSEMAVTAQQCLLSLKRNIRLGGEQIRLLC